VNLLTALSNSHKCQKCGRRWQPGRMQEFVRVTIKNEKIKHKEFNRWMCDDCYADIKKAVDEHLKAKMCACPECAAMAPVLDNGIPASVDEVTGQSLN
jgi:hypothetical protein